MMLDIIVGSIGMIVSAVLGSILTARYTHKFQAELLVRQLDAQKELLEDQKKFQQELLQKQLDQELAIESRREQKSRMDKMSDRAYQAQKDLTTRNP